MRLLLCLAMIGVTLRCQAGPRISIREAVELAEKAKAERADSDAVYIESLTLEVGSLLGGKSVWIAKWSAPLPANNPKQSEFGVQISMDGSVKHLIKAPPPARGTLH